MFGMNQNSIEIKVFACNFCFNCWLGKVLVNDGITYEFLDPKDKSCPHCGKEGISLDDLEKISQSLEQLEITHNKVSDFFQKKTAYQITTLINQIKTTKKLNEKFDNLFVSDWLKIAEQALEERLKEEQEENHTPFHGAD